MTETKDNARMPNSRSDLITSVDHTPASAVSALRGTIHRYNEGGIDSPHADVTMSRQCAEKLLEAAYWRPPTADQLRSLPDAPSRQPIQVVYIPEGADVTMIVRGVEPPHGESRAVRDYLSRKPPGL